MGQTLSDNSCGRRWLLVGTYVGFATVGAFVAWYMCEHFMGLDLSADGHSTVTWYQLTHWNQCSTWSNFHVRPSSAAWAPAPLQVQIRIGWLHVQRAPVCPILLCMGCHH